MVDHQITFRGVALQGADSLPAILERTDQDFLPAILDKLSREGGLAEVMGSRAAQRNSSGVLKLFQPVQRTFNVALFEVVCDEYLPFGQPRLDPSRIESAGLVLRRRAAGSWEGWRQADGVIKGWVPFRGAAELEMDPDPARRPLPSAGDQELDRRLALLRVGSETLSESVSPLFVAPPEACRATGKTILYGLVPVTSSELSEVETPLPSFDEDDISSPNHLPPYFRSGLRAWVPRAGSTVTSADAGDGDLEQFVTMLQQVAVEFDAFGDGEASRQLYAELQDIDLPMPDETTRPAGEFLQEAARVLVERAGRDEAPQRNLSLTMPVEWPLISADQERRLVQRIGAAVAANLVATVPNQGRFDDPAREYQLWGFVRVKREDGCPPDLIWSQPSEAFVIAPWYESNDAPPVTVQLPDVFDRDLLKSMKPNVAFSMSPRMFRMLSRNKPTDVLSGDMNDGGGGIDLGWICSFSIPIITICAFIVLNIFLSLFDLVFRWLMFVKVCIPRPK